MKRLMDETTDELTRSLLSAGIEHRPPPGNKARVIVALGAGGAMGLFSSNAFAWLSTTAGKVTAVGVAVGVAGAVWVAAPAGHDVRADAGADARGGARSEPSSAISQRLAAAPAEPAGASTAEAASSGADGAGSASASEAARLADARWADAAQASEPEASDGSLARAAAPSARFEAGERRGSGGRERAARKVSKRPSREKVAAAKQGEPGAGSEPGVEALGSGSLESTSEQAALDSEVRLVDDMHWAARRNDREALGRYLEQYRATFPEGQLRKEVAGFAERLERAD